MSNGDVNAILMLGYVLLAIAAGALIGSPRASGEAARWLRAHSISLREARELRTRRKTEELARDLGL